MALIGAILVLLGALCLQSPETGTGLLRKMSTPKEILFATMGRRDLGRDLMATNQSIQTFAKLPRRRQRAALRKLVEESRSWWRVPHPGYLPPPEVDLAKLNLLSIAKGSKPRLVNTSGDLDFLVGTPSTLTISIKKGFRPPGTIMGPGWPVPVPLTGDRKVFIAVLRLINAGYFDLKSQKPRLARSRRPALRHLQYRARSAQVGPVQAHGWRQPFARAGTRLRMTGINNSNGSLTTYVNDAKYRLTADNTSGTKPHSYAYSYNGKDDILTNNESGGTITFAHSLGGRITTALSSSGTSTYSYDANGNLHLVQDPASTTTMAYDKENRLAVHQNGSSTATYAYSGDNLKRNELVDGVSMTLIWDGTNYLGTA